VETHSARGGGSAAGGAGSIMWLAVVTRMWFGLLRSSAERQRQIDNAKRILREAGFDT
jgi:hypothetical protein